MIRKFIFGFACFLLANNFYGQSTDSKKDTIKHWSINGQNNFMLNQSSFSNWNAGGANNTGWIATINYDMTYQKGKELWENHINLGYGQNDTKGTGKRKTQDNIYVNSNYGHEVAKSWYISGGISFQSQFAPGYEDGNNPKAKKLSNFMAPGYLNFGVGMTYRPNSNFTLTMRPANIRWTFVLDKDLQYKGHYGLKHDGDSSLLQFGFLATAQYKVTLMENITLSNSGSIFSNYLDQPTHMVLSYAAILNMKVNKFVSANVTVNILYDHDELQKTQLKQTLGIGLSYNFNNGVKNSNKVDFDNSWQRTAQY